MPRLVHRPLLIAGAALLSFASASPVIAQREGAAGDTSRVIAIDTLSVRVLRTPIPARRAPYAVSVRAGEELRRARPGMALDETLGGIPGVQVDNRFNYALGERISVRGFGARAQFGVRGVRVLVDGIPATLPDGQTTLNHVDVGALGRAEVIRGPASALYGNAAGGVVRLSTLPPPPVPLASEYRAVGGSDGLLRLQTSAAGTSGALAYRGSLTRLTYDGYREHAGAENTLGSASLAWRRGGDAVRLSFTGVRYDARSAGSLTDSLLRADRRAVAPVYLRDDTGEEGRQGQLGVTWEHALGGGALEAAAYVLGRSIENPIPFSFVDLDRRVGGVRAAVSGLLAVGGHNARWTAGAEAERQRDDRKNFTNESGRPGTETLDQRERVTALAGFAQALLPLGGRVDLLGAVRYDRFRFQADDRLVTAANPDDSGARTMDAWSPTAGVTFAATDAVSLYANFATAFETPTTTELVNRPTGAGGFNPELSPQRTTSVEAGVKGRAGPAAFELAAYRARVRDALIPFEVEGAPGRQFFRNAGRAVHRGVEASATVDVAPWMRARAAYTLTDARFGRYVKGGTDLEGNRVPGIAPHRVDASVDWTSRRGPFGGIEARHESAVPVADTDSTGAFDSPAYTVFDLRAGWAELRVGRARATPSIGVRNLFGVDYNTSVSINAAGRRYYEPGPGRTFHAGLMVRLGGETEGGG
jgi:iron complex outermembrane receptor protein